MTLTTNAMMSGHTDSGLEYSDRYLSISSQLGDPWLRMCALNDKAMLLVAAHRFQDALAMAPEAIRYAQSIKSVFFEFGARLVFAEALLGLRRPGEALASLQQTLRLQIDAWPLLTARAWRSLAATHAALGDDAGCRRAETTAAQWTAKVGKGGMGSEFANLKTPSSPQGPIPARTPARRSGKGPGKAP
jgi:tetratricopeptide (TPR) repeat protein